MRLSLFPLPSEAPRHRRELQGDVISASLGREVSMVRRGSTSDLWAAHWVGAEQLRAWMLDSGGLES